ncbi:MAG: hypothetical protein M1281_08655 [Chloroflexi bacterium]|nr:hypothetical protein [Chloroflexota bacterium]
MIRYIDIHEFNEQPDNDVLFAELERLEPEAAYRQKTMPGIQPVELPHGGIVMYCTPWCPDCKEARRWFQECNLPFTEVDITKNAWASEQVRIWGRGKTITPTFDIDGTIVVNFDMQKLSQILKI